eukprot:364822-Chlamydomonas_euryale.AAC.9
MHARRYMCATVAALEASSRGSEHRAAALTQASCEWASVAGGEVSRERRGGKEDGCGEEEEQAWGRKGGRGARGGKGKEREEHEGERLCIRGGTGARGRGKETGEQEGERGYVKGGRGARRRGKRERRSNEDVERCVLQHRPAPGEGKVRGGEAAVAA